MEKLEVEDQLRLVCGIAIYTSQKEVLWKMVGEGTHKVGGQSSSVIFLGGEAKKEGKERDSDRIYQPLPTCAGREPTN